MIKNPFAQNCMQTPSVKEPHLIPHVVEANTVRLACSSCVENTQLPVPLGV